MKISVVTINYNNRAGLRKTIESVVNQTCQDFEYIVIDGGSTDKSKDVIEEYSKQITYWVSELDSGIYNAMNKGIEHANGDYLLFLNSGDYLYESTTLEKCVPLFDNIDIVMGKVMCTPSNRIAWDNITLPLTMLDFYKGGPIPHQATFIKRSLFKNNKYDEKYRIVSDWKFFIESTIFKNASCKVINNIVSYFDENGISATNKRLCDVQREEVLKELMPIGILTDYHRFANGDYYIDCSYNLFFQKLQPYSYSKYIYIICNIIVRILSIFIRSAKYFRRFPIFLKKK